MRQKDLLSVLLSEGSKIVFGGNIKMARRLSNADPRVSVEECSVERKRITKTGKEVTRMKNGAKVTIDFSKAAISPKVSDPVAEEKENLMKAEDELKDPAPEITETELAIEVPAENVLTEEVRNEEEKPFKKAAESFSVWRKKKFAKPNATGRN